jgi:TatA/E family protein of Tat protein translocase
MFGSIGFPELILIFIVVLLIFGPQKLPEFAKTLGKTLREFRKTINEAKATLEDEINKTDTLGDLRQLDREIKDQTRIDSVADGINLLKDLKEIDRDIKQGIMTIGDEKKTQ